VHGAHQLVGRGLCIGAEGAWTAPAPLCRPGVVVHACRAMCVVLTSWCTGHAVRVGVGKGACMHTPSCSCTCPSHSHAGHVPPPPQSHTTPLPFTHAPFLAPLLHMTVCMEMVVQWGCPPTAPHPLHEGWGGGAHAHKWEGGVHT
jgi:hypothetical protein